MNFKDTDEEYRALCMMEKLGGSFVRKLAALYRVGDPINRAKLRNTFNDYFTKYKNAK